MRPDPTVSNDPSGQVPVKLLGWGLSALFVIAGAVQLAGVPIVAERFTIWGYPDVLRVLVGVLEILGGLGLLSPRIATISASLLVTIMVGAFATLLLMDFALLALIPGALVVLLLYVGKEQLERPMRTQSSHEVPPSVM